jgi:ERF superfamily
MESIEFLRLLEDFKKLSDTVHSSLQKLEPKKEPFRSEHINELAISLAKAQGEFHVAGLNKSNPYFKSPYADLESIVRASRPSLSRNGLSVVQNIIDHEEGQKILHTILMHISGQYIESRVRIIPPKNDVQSIFSTVNHMRRIAYSSLISVCVEDEDDDGEGSVATSREVFAKGVALNAKYDPRENAAETISKDQLDEFHYELSEYPDIAEQILDGLKIQSLADIPKSKYGVAIRRVREIKIARNTATR